MRPSLPKHTVVYDTNQVLHYRKTLPPNNQLLLETLTQKLCMLLCILSGQRAQTIVSISLEYIHHDKHTYTCYIPKVLKTTTTKFHQAPLEYIAFPPDDRVCVVACLDEYIERTKLIRENTGDEKQPIISYSYPHKALRRATLARYVKTFLGRSGVYLTVFTAHSTRQHHLARQTMSVLA